MDQVPVLHKETLLVSFDLTRGPSNYILIVGKKEGDAGAVTIVNAFEGQKAMDIFKLLTTVEKKEELINENNQLAGSL